MLQSVLNLGEYIALAARLAAIEHVRQELAALAETDGRTIVDEQSPTCTEPDDSADPSLRVFVHQQWSRFIGSATLSEAA